jgi:spore coat protein H
MIMKPHCLLTLFLLSLVNPAFAGDTLHIPANRVFRDDTRRIVLTNYIPGTIPGITTLSADFTYQFTEAAAAFTPGNSYTIRREPDGMPYELHFTALPLIEINSYYPVQDEPRLPAEFTLVEANGNRITSTIGIEYRGGWSQTLDKKSLRIEFWTDTTGNDTRDFRLLGMRNDDDWNLQAIFNEPMRLRSKTNNELWLDIHTPYYAFQEPTAVPGIRMEYAELFLNGAYRGVYAVGERVDRKQIRALQYNGNMRGELYKGDDWQGGATTFRRLSPYSNFSRVWSGFELEYPDEITDWSKLYEFVDFVVNSPDDIFFRYHTTRFHTDNAVDYFLFLNLLRAADNTGKNLFIGKYNAGQPYFYIPWDLDGTFGMKWDGTPENITHDLLSNGFYDRLWTDCQMYGFRDRLQTRWNSLRSNGLLSHDSIMGRFMANHAILVQNGVYQREMKAWPKFEYDSGHFNYMSEWLHNRLQVLDSMFNEPCKPSARQALQVGDFRLWPNPASRELHLQHNLQGEIKARLIDAAGKVFRHYQVHHSAETLQLPPLTDGIYFLHLSNESGSQMLRILIRN